MSAQNWLGLALGITGVFGMWVAGKGRWQGWAVGLAIQPVWVAFFLVVGSYTALLVPALYGSVYARNLWRWSRPAPERLGDPDVCMCGSYIRDHGHTENHSPVSETEYLARGQREARDA